MRSTYYPGVCTKPGTYYQGWFMYMRYTQGQNEEYVLNQVYLLSKFDCMYKHMYACKYCMYICTYVCTYVHMHMYMHVSTVGRQVYVHYIEWKLVNTKLLSKKYVNLSKKNFCEPTLHFMWNTYIHYLHNCNNK